MLDFTAQLPKTIQNRCCRQEHMASGQKLAGMAGVHPGGPGPEIEGRIQGMGTTKGQSIPKPVLPLLAPRPEIILKYEFDELQVQYEQPHATGKNSARREHQ